MPGGKRTAMSCIRFRFKSALEFDQIRFEGLQMSVAELREKIMLKTNPGIQSEFTLEIMDAQTKRGMRHLKNAIVSLVHLSQRWQAFASFEIGCLLVEHLFHCGMFCFLCSTHIHSLYR